jgi:NAD+ diphosphatase
VIFSVVNQTGPESLILLGRQARWDKGRYSVIAGFVEPGESLEDAVRREALEETGLRLHRVSYIASQPWPFPDSLMVGFDCETEDRHIELKDQELEAANWFSASDIEKGVRSGELSMPFKLSISWYLIDRWFRHQTGDTIASLNKGV